jgi:CheY-like chemotaxis protein
VPGNEIDQIHGKKTKLIFVAEDDSDQVLLFQMAVKKANLPDTCFQFFPNGMVVRNYLESAFTEPVPLPDLLVVDLKMPVMDGFELIAWIRDHPRYKSIALVVMSSSEQAADKERARRLGCNYYFLKPADINDLVKVVTGFYMVRFAPLKVD